MPAGPPPTTTTSASATTGTSRAGSCTVFMKRLLSAGRPRRPATMSLKPPRHEVVLQHRDEAEQRQRERRRDRHGGVEQRRAVVVRRGEDEVAEALVGADPLRDDRAEQARGAGDAQRREEVRERRRPAQVAEYLPLRRRKHVHQLL